MAQTPDRRGCIVPTIEIIRDWLTTGTLVGLLGIAARFTLAQRKQSLLEKQDEREGLAGLVAALQVDVSYVRSQFEQARFDHQRCQHDMALVRQETEYFRRNLLALSRRHGIPLEEELFAPFVAPPSEGGADGVS